LVCFALYAASRAVINAYRPLLDEAGLTYPQYLVMLVLWQRGPQPVKELGSALHLDSGTLSPLLKRLESAGLVRRARNPEDQRNLALALTPAGRRLRAEAEKIPAGIVERLGMPVDELLSLHGALTRVIAASQQSLAADSAAAESTVA